MKDLIFLSHQLYLANKEKSDKILISLDTAFKYKPQYELAITTGQQLSAQEKQQLINQILNRFAVLCYYDIMYGLR